MDELGAHAVQLHQIARDAARQDVGVQLGLDGDAVGDRVQAAGEAKERRQLCDASGGARVADGRSSAFTSAVSDTDLLAIQVWHAMRMLCRPADRGSSLLATEVAMLDPDGDAGQRREPRGEFAAITTERCLPPVQPIATTECPCSRADSPRARARERRRTSRGTRRRPPGRGRTRDLLVLAGQGAKLVVPERVGQEPHVGDEVGIRGEART